MSLPNPTSNNDFMLVPEIAIYNLLETALKFVEKDYEYQVATTGDERLSYLYYLTEKIRIQRLNVFKEAKEIFLNTDPESKNRLTINLGWPQVIKEGINVTITHSGEQYAQNNMGVDQSSDVFEEYVYDINDNQNDQTNAYRNTYNRRYKASYRLIITGNGTNDILIVFNVLKALLISLEGTSTFNRMGFENSQITSQDMEIRSDVIKHKWAKSINLMFEYNFKVPDLNRLRYWNNLIFKGEIIDE